jgi:hypothetical protein
MPLATPASQQRPKMAAAQRAWDWLLYYIVIWTSIAPLEAHDNSTVSTRPLLTPTILTAFPPIPTNPMTCPRTEPKWSSENYTGLATKLFTADQHQAFERDGFLVVSGLLDGDMDDFVEAGDAFVANTKAMKAYFSSLGFGMIFQAGKASNHQTVTKAFRHIALDTLLPQAAAELMRLPPTERVRVLR